MATKTISISLPPELLVQIDYLAARRYQTRSEWIKNTVMWQVEDQLEQEEYFKEVAYEAGKDADNGKQRD